MRWRWPWQRGESAPPDPVPPEALAELARAKAELRRREAEARRQGREARELGAFFRRQNEENHLAERVRRALGGA